MAGASAIRELEVLSLFDVDPIEMEWRAEAGFSAAPLFSSETLDSRAIASPERPTSAVTERPWLVSSEHRAPSLGRALREATK